MIGEKTGNKRQERNGKNKVIVSKGDKSYLGCENPSQEEEDTTTDNKKGHYVS